MNRPNISKPSTSKNPTGASFRELTQEAKRRFGVAQTRPQDLDPNMLRFIRRTNLEIIAPFPENYQQNLFNWVQQIPPLNIPTLPKFLDHPTIFQDSKNQDLSIIMSIKPKNEEFVVLAVDAEFYQEISYDGFISVASVSSPEKTFVVDCLFENRTFASQWLSKMLVGRRTLKVLCGGDNDIFRFQKDWSCFAFGVVDVQDMFSIFKKLDSSRCFQMCVPALKRRLLEKKKAITEVSCREQFKVLNKPGLEFLMDVFFAHENVAKDKVATFADWSVRPLAPQLIRYSAVDSFFTLKVFYALYNIIGLTGLKEAATETIKKLTNRSNLPRYRDNIIDTSAGQWLVERILAWRKYLALRLDYKPAQIVLSARIPQLARSLKELSSTSDLNAVANLLERFYVPSQFRPAAKLLCAYLEESGDILTRMKATICHHCNGLGHSANFCYFENNPELKREFRLREEQRQKNAAQYNRRRLHYCERRKLDPETTTCFWEESPGVSKKE